MRTRQWIVTGSWTAILALVPLATLAQTITVQVGACAPKTGNLSVNIAGTCGNVTISNGVGGAARVRAVSDTTTDRLVLENAVLTATATVANFPITYSAPLSAPPTAPGNTWYYAEGSGSFFRSGGTPVGDSITFEGWIKPTVTWDQVGVDDFFQVSGVSSFSPATGFKTVNMYGALNSPRDVQGKIFFTLNNTTDQLRVTSLLIRNGPPPDSAEARGEACFDATCDKCIPRSAAGYLCRVLDVACGACVKDDSDCPQEETPEGGPIP
jgi:hypothetical protein